METILNIEEVSLTEDDRWYGEDGFKITTTEQEVLLLIDSGQACCEDWGYLMSEDDIQKFVGAHLHNISITDPELENRELVGDLDEGEAMFVNIHTSRGVLQFVAYNGHNGYYGHRARVVSKQLTTEEWL